MKHDTDLFEKDPNYKPSVTITSILDAFDNHFTFINADFSKHKEELKDFLRSSLNAVLDECVVEKKNDMTWGIIQLNIEGRIGYNYAIDALEAKKNEIKQ